MPPTLPPASAGPVRAHCDPKKRIRGLHREDPHVDLRMRHRRVVGEQAGGRRRASSGVIGRGSPTTTAPRPVSRIIARGSDLRIPSARTLSDCACALRAGVARASAGASRNCTTSRCVNAAAPSAPTGHGSLRRLVGERRRCRSDDKQHCSESGETLHPGRQE